MRVGTTDPVIGVPMSEIHQSQEPIGDRLLYIERDLRECLRRITKLESEVEALKQRTWWSMLKEMLRL